jgi:uncharacterized membrane protein YkoI
MKRNSIAAVTLVAALATTGAATLFAAERETESEEKVTYHSSIQVPANLERQSELQKLAKITKEDAARAATAAAPGTVTETKLENEDSNLVYTVEITNGNKTTEVIVDAGNASVLAVAADEADEQGGETEEKD